MSLPSLFAALINMEFHNMQRTFRISRSTPKPPPKPPPPPKFSSKHAQRIALVRHATSHDEQRIKAPVTLPRLKFLEDDNAGSA